MPVKGTDNIQRIAESSTSSILRAEAIQDYGYNMVGGMPGDTLNPVNNAHMIQDAYLMWIKNPLANSIIETFLDYTFGDGVTYKAKDPRVQEVLDTYWNDPDNDWENKTEDRFRDMSLFGELLLETETLKGTGRVKVSSIYPALITGVKHHPKYIERIEKVLINNNDDDAIDIIKYDPLTDVFKGKGFFFRINRSTFQTRGIGDLFVNRDWLRLYDKSLYATMERAGLLLSFVWDVKVNGATNEQLKQKFDQIKNNPPQPGSFRVHNENEEWKAESPDLRGGDFEDIYRLLKSQIIGGARQPEHLFGMGDNVNFASAHIMSKTFFKKVKRRQKYVIGSFKKQFDFVIGKAIEYNTLDQEAVKNGDIDLSYTITLPDPNEDAIQTFSQSIDSFSRAIVLLEANGHIDKETSKRVVDMIVGQLGIKEDLQSEQNEYADSPAKESVSRFKKRYKKAIESIKKSK